MCERLEIHVDNGHNIWEKPSNNEETKMIPKKKCMVVGHSSLVKRCQRLLGDEWHVLRTFQPVLGYHFSMVFFLSGWDNVNPEECKKWVKECLLAKVDKGQIYDHSDVKVVGSSPKQMRNQRS